MYTCEAFVKHCRMLCRRLVKFGTEYPALYFDVFALC